MNELLARHTVSFAGAGFSGGTVDFSRVASWTHPPDFGSGFDMSHPPAGVMLPTATSPSPDSPVPRKEAGNPVRPGSRLPRPENPPRQGGNAALPPAHTMTPDTLRPARVRAGRPAPRLAAPRNGLPGR